MGMFDRPENWEDHFKENDLFDLESAKVGPQIQTQYGTGRPNLLKIDGKWYSIFGEGITQQIEQMDAEDLPARVFITRVPTKSGNSVKKILPEGAKADDIPF